MGGHRDELSLHKRSLDVQVGLLKEEMVSACMHACVSIGMYSDIEITQIVYIILVFNSWMRQFLLLY